MCQDKCMSSKIRQVNKAKRQDGSEARAPRQDPMNHLENIRDQPPLECPKASLAPAPTTVSPSGPVCDFVAYYHKTPCHHNPKLPLEPALWRFEVWEIVRTDLAQLSLRVW